MEMVFGNALTFTYSFYTKESWRKLKKNKIQLEKSIMKMLEVGGLKNYLIKVEIKTVGARPRKAEMAKGVTSTKRVTVKIYYFL